MVLDCRESLLVSNIDYPYSCSLSGIYTVFTCHIICRNCFRAQTFVLELSSYSYEIKGILFVLFSYSCYCNGILASAPVVLLGVSFCSRVYKGWHITKTLQPIQLCTQLTWFALSLTECNQSWVFADCVVKMAHVTICQSI